MRISDWSSDVCSSACCLPLPGSGRIRGVSGMGKHELWKCGVRITAFWAHSAWKIAGKTFSDPIQFGFRGIARQRIGKIAFLPIGNTIPALRSEEHTSELQSLMRITYDIFRFKKKTH